MATTAVAELVLPFDYFGQAKFRVPIKVLEMTSMAYYTNFLPGGTLERFFQVDTELARNLKETAQQHIAVISDETWRAFRVAIEEFKRTFVVTQYLLDHRYLVYRYYVTMSRCCIEFKFMARSMSAAELSEYQKLYSSCLIVLNVLKPILEEIETAKALLSMKG